MKRYHCSWMEESVALKMTREMIQNRYQRQYVLRTHEILTEALEQALPTEPLVNKAFEGMVKGVQGDRIVMALEKVQARYAFAYGQAREITKNREQISRMGELIADCLAAGVKNGDMERLSQQLQERSGQMAKKEQEQLSLATFRAARSMARLGVSSATASDVLHQALQNNYRAKEMEGLRHSFMGRSKSNKPENLARRFSEGIQRGRGVENMGEESEGGISGGGAGGEQGAGGGESGSDGGGQGSSGGGQSGGGGESGGEGGNGGGQGAGGGQSGSGGGDGGGGGRW